MRSIPNIALIAYSLDPGDGGVAVVARLMAKTLGAWHPRRRINLQGLIFKRPASALSVFLFPIVSAHGSRARFAARVQAQACRNDLCVYDCANMARAHRLASFWRPSLVYMHGVELWENARPEWVAACRRATWRLSNSHYTLTRFRALHGDPGAAQVCELATETDVPPPASTGAQVHTPPNVLIVGRMSDTENYKGHRELIEAWPHVMQRVPEAALHIAGKGSGMAALQQLAARSPAANAIRFHGFVTDAQLDALYRQATVFAMPSRGEGFGLVYIDAMRYGLPVIASCHDAGQEVVLDGETGFCVNLDHPPELAQRLIALLNDPAKAQTMGDAGRRRWHEHYRFSAFTTRFSAALEKMGFWKT